MRLRLQHESCIEEEQIHHQGAIQHHAGDAVWSSSQYKPATAGTSGLGTSRIQLDLPLVPLPASGLQLASRMCPESNTRTNLYVPNTQQQGESTDIWIQPPREVPGLQSTTYYNLPGQAAHPAFMRTHGGSFNTTSQPSHVQYPGLYHQPQPGSIPNPHHMVHQQYSISARRWRDIFKVCDKKPEDKRTEERPQGQRHRGHCSRQRAMKEKKTSTAKKPALHPHYLEMIKEAITSLEEQPAAELRSSFLAGASMLRGRTGS